MTLSDEAYQELRDAAAAVIRAVGVETGGSNIQFARSRETGELRVIEMNPRVSRSSALASKATGYPIAKVAAKLAVGYTLDEIPNDLTKTTPASFEPTLDYVVVKFPRFAFEKFPGADATLGTQMKSVGEAMGIGRTFAEAFLEGARLARARAPARRHRGRASRRRSPGRRCIRGSSQEIAARSGEPGPRRHRAREARRAGTTTRSARRSGERARRCVGARHAHGIRPVLPAASTPAPARSTRASNYFYSTWGEEDEAPPSRDKPGVVILGSGPNRIGQGIEFDYCCVHAAQTLPRARLRGRHGQLQPGDRLDRLRHLRPPLLRAARRRRRCSPSATASSPSASSRSSAARRRSGSRAHIEDGRLPHPRARRTRRSTSPRIASASGALAEEARHPLPALGDRAKGRRGASSRSARSATRCSSGPSYVLGGRRDARLLRRRASSQARWRRSAGRVLARPLRRERDRDRRRRALRRRRDVTSPRSCSTSRRRASTPATRRACLPGAVARRQRTRARSRARRAAARAGARRRRARQRPARGRGRRRATCSRRTRARRAPCRSRARRSGMNLVDAACRLAAWRSCSADASSCPVSAADAGQRQGGRAAVRALPRRRPRARARDALDRRGDGERRATLPDGPREGRARSRTCAADVAAPPSSPSATADKPSVADRGRRCCRGSASRSSRREARRDAAGAAGLAVEHVAQGGRAAGTSRPWSTSSAAALRPRDQHARQRLAARARTAT